MIDTWADGYRGWMVVYILWMDKWADGYISGGWVG